MAVFKLLRNGENAFLSISIKCWRVVKVTYTSKSRITQEFIGYPEKPRRPLNSFLRFYLSVKTDYVTQDGASNFPVFEQNAELLKKISSIWRKMTEKEKDKYIKEYEQEMVDYKEKLEAYNNSLTEAQKEDIMWLKQKIRESRTKNGSVFSKQELKNFLNKPPKPLPMFVQFLKESQKFNKITFSSLAMKWKNLPENERKKFKYEYEKEKEKYSESLKDWEMKMIQEGNVEVIRAKTLKELLRRF